LFLTFGCGMLVAGLAVGFGFGVLLVVELP
jgi:hypothetical protein